MNTGTDEATLLSRAEIAKYIEQVLRSYCQQKIKDAKDIGPGYVRLWEYIDNYLMGGGKRIRPYLCMLSYQAAGGKSPHDVLNVAAAWEMLHACLLVHDDIIDRDNLRHGKPNIAGAYEPLYSQSAGNDASHYAMSSALLAGDLLLGAAFELIHTADIQPKQKQAVTKNFQDALFSVGGGELIDVESGFTPIEFSQPLAIATQKTARYSFELPLTCGAELAGMPKSQRELLKSVGHDVGIAFQLHDDILGVFGDTAQTGKPSQTDIYEKKRTQLIKYVYEGLFENDRAQLSKLYSYQRNLTDDEVQVVITFIRKTNAKRKIEEKIDFLSKRSIRTVGNLSWPDPYKEALTEFVHSLQKRNS